MHMYAIIRNTGYISLNNWNHDMLKPQWDYKWPTELQKHGIPWQYAYQI